MGRLRHLGIQAAAGLAAWVFIAPAAQPLPWAGLQGLLAALGAATLKQPGWQRLAHLLFAPAIVLALQAQVSPGWYLLALLLTLAVGRNALVERVPLYRSAAAVAERLAQRLAQRSAVLEAGCGDGRLALQLSRARPDLRLHALENALGSCLLAWLRWRAAGRPSSLAVACRSFWRENWGDYDAIYVFLSPEPMPRVWSKFVAEARPGSLLISNTFEVPGIEPDERLPLGGPLQKELLIWRHPHGSE
ncbi:class I SAM-dependent methyltransferase [Chromobacterium sp. IIBBL 290-4]|uniref:class I SAM-dependent methyltransferase n=1 Tax=Chromobacterium sp. IIBBL 290-4 TaxID=2953890 RepID=UPI0020B7CC7F|nr:class I SAM-dependent methyltransferase [Chromobacterium sp. IIBBL 290-4]UTH73868.1 class I SAM-dependent methyltransferase [Chromobacterium sp. IIBBL 290-4]